MKYLKKFKSLVDANEQGENGLDSPHIDIIEGMDAVNFVEVSTETFTCEFGSSGKVENVSPIYAPQMSNEIRYTTSDGQIANIQSYVVKGSNGNNLAITSHFNGSITFNDDIYSFEEIVSTNEITSIILPDCVHSVDFTMALDEITIGEDCTLIQGLFDDVGAKTYILKNTDNVTFRYLSTINNVKLCYDEDNNSTITFNSCTINEVENGGIWAENKRVGNIIIDSASNINFYYDYNTYKIGGCENLSYYGWQLLMSSKGYFSDIENLQINGTMLATAKKGKGLIFDNIDYVSFINVTVSGEMVSAIGITGDKYPQKITSDGEEVIPAFIQTIYVHSSLENSGIKTNTFWRPYVGIMDFTSYI